MIVRKEIIGDCTLYLGDCRIACKRIRDAYAQPDFFVAPPAPKPEQLSLLESNP